MQTIDTPIFKLPPPPPPPQHTYPSPHIPAPSPTYLPPLHSHLPIPSTPTYLSFPHPNYPITICQPPSRPFSLISCLCNPVLRPHQSVVWMDIYRPILLYPFTLVLYINWKFCISSNRRAQKFFSRIL